MSSKIASNEESGSRRPMRNWSISRRLTLLYADTGSFGGLRRVEQRIRAAVVTTIRFCRGA